MCLFKSACSLEPPDFEVVSFGILEIRLIAAEFSIKHNGYEIVDTRLL